jgi:hypothetical protein
MKPPFRLCVLIEVLLTLVVVAILVPQTQALADNGGYLTYFAGTNPSQPSITLDAGLVPFSDRERPKCFDSTSEVVGNGTTSMSLYIVEKSIADQIDQQKHWSGGFGAIAKLKLFEGNDDFSGSISNTVRSALSDTSLVLVLEVNASTGFRQPTHQTLNLNGTAQLNAGRSNFLEHCGILFAVREDLANHLYVVITIHTDSKETKAELLQSLGYKGTFTAYGIGGGGRAAYDLDQKIQEKTGITEVDLKVSATSGMAMAGLGDLSQAFLSIKQRPVESAVTAVGKFLSAHGGGILGISMSSIWL